MKLSFVLAVLTVNLVFFALGAQSQNAGLLQEKGTIEGTVIDAFTAQPLRGVDVKLIASSPGVSTPAPASTDPDGRFMFGGLSAGRYLVLASHNGYVDNHIDNRRFVPLTSGQRVKDIVVRLVPDGAIAGHITNEAGKPFPGVSVAAMRPTYMHGRRQLIETSRAVAITNQAGEYRIADLPPGKYYIRAKPPASLKTKPGSDRAYVPVYYPATNELARSVGLTLRVGEDLAGIDMNLAPARTVRIRGRVINARTSLPSTEAEVTLLSDQGETVFSPGQNFSTGGQASFEFRGVPPGSYVLVAQQPSSPREPKTIWGRTSVEIGDTNIEHADIVVSTGVDVSGHIRLEGKTDLDLGKNVAELVVVLQSQEPSSLADLTPDIDNATVNPDGTFVFHEVPDGSYRIDFRQIPSGFYLQSSGTSEVLESGIPVSRGHSPPAVELVLDFGTGQIDGTVMIDEQPSQHALAVLIPDGKRRTQQSYYRQAFADQTGRFAMRNVVPGDYTLFAWEEIDRGAYFDPEFLGRYEDRGHAVHIEENAHLSVELDAIPAAETLP
jgi:hypothetical protein